MGKMSLTQQKLDELELLQSVYPELIEPDLEDLCACQEHTGSSQKCPILRLNINFKNVKLAVTLPSHYPDSEEGRIRILWSKYGSGHDKSLQELISRVARDNAGSICLLQVVSETSDLIESIDREQEALKNSVFVGPETEINTRIWYYAHHIYSKGKRTSMLKWSEELCLTGFILPGKPGIICIEGCKSNCREFNSRVRAMNWQLLKLQHEELSIDILKFSSFEELIFDVHGRANTHQDLGQFREYLSSLGMCDIFQILFNI